MKTGRKLSRYDGKPIRVTTVDGLVLVGEGLWRSSDYGEHEPGRGQE